MKKIALYGFMIVTVAAVVIVAASWSVTKDGKIGVRSAAACAKKDTPECLPRIGYLDTQGQWWTEESLNGKVVMINFWASWCGPCKAEVPALTAAYKKYADRGFVLLGMMADDPTEEELAGFSKRWNLDYPVVRLDQGIYHAFDYPDKLPTTFIYDRAGELRLFRPGQITEEELAETLDELLAEPAP